MGGKRNFTSEEVSKIKELIRQKLQAPNNEQKGIRAKIRRIAAKRFYYYSGIVLTQYAAAIIIFDGNEGVSFPL